MAMKAQAVVIDALFFLMICGFAATVLLWAGNVYGNKVFDAYRYMYLNDYETSAMQVLSALEYTDDSGVQRAWLNDLGGFMLGYFNESDPPGRYEVFLSKWDEVCLQAPAPLLLTVFSSGKVQRGSQELPLYFSCGTLLSKDAREKGSLDDPCRIATRSQGVLCERDRRTGKVFVFTTKYPYYSTPITTKSCDVVSCEMEIKVYY